MNGFPFLTYYFKVSIICAKHIIFLITNVRCSIFALESNKTGIYPVFQSVFQNFYAFKSINTI